MPEVVRIELLGRFRVSVGARTIEEDEWKLVLTRFRGSPENLMNGVQARAE